jgi:hypothetical protein
MKAMSLYTDVPYTAPTKLSLFMRGNTSYWTEQDATVIRVHWETDARRELVELELKI